MPRAGRPQLPAHATHVPPRTAYPQRPRHHAEVIWSLRSSPRPLHSAVEQRVAATRRRRRLCALTEQFARLYHVRGGRNGKSTTAGPVAGKMVTCRCGRWARRPPRRPACAEKRVMRKAPPRSSPSLPRSHRGDAYHVAEAVLPLGDDEGAGDVVPDNLLRANPSAAPITALGAPGWRSGHRGRCRIRIAVTHHRTAMPTRRDLGDRMPMLAFSERTRLSPPSQRRRCAPCHDHRSPSPNG